MDRKLPILYILAISCIGNAQDKPSDKPAIQFQITGQATFIWQGMTAFHSLYSVTNSLPSTPQARLSDTYTVYLGAHITPGLDAFVNPEMARGGGIGDALGLASFTNGDVIRNPSLGQDPYWGRYFIRWTAKTGNGKEEAEKDDNQLPGKRPANRLVLTAGKLGTNDIFDTNGYSNSTRTQFMNWSLINNPAYDYAADTRGYTTGMALEWIHPSWTLRVGSFLMPVVANGIDLDSHFSDSRGDQAEVEWHPTMIHGRQASKVKLLGYRNLATMGDYAESIANAHGGVPDITSTRQRGRVKYGFGLNFEQPIANDGETGLFARLGWSDGKTESFAYTEADDHFSLGAQISGQRWNRKGDLVGIAFSSNGLSGPHRQYLADGGSGFLLGDGALNYGREMLLESYYLHPLSKNSSLTLGSQFIANPGYNQSRGPVPTFSLRLHFAF